MRDLEGRITADQEAKSLRKFEELEGELSIVKAENGDYASQIGELEAANQSLQDKVYELQEEIEEIRKSQYEGENEQVK